MTPNGMLTTLFSFNGTNGFGPVGELVQGPDGNLYGTTSHGGNHYDTLHQGGAGTIFRITTNGTFFTNLYFFTEMGEPIRGLALGADGNFYGTTKWGGKGHEGTIFKISCGGSFETLRSLDATTGTPPDSSLLLGYDGILYGTMAFGGQYYKGTFFSLTTNGTLSTLVSFNPPNFCRFSRNKLVQGADGEFYGTTEFGGAHNNVKIGNDDIGDGTVFRVTTNGVVTTLADFTGWNGAHPRGALVRGKNGNFYGTTAYGNLSHNTTQGAYTCGTIFRVTTNGIVNTLYDFTVADVAYRRTNGSAPCGIVEDTNGNFYGTTTLGGEKAYLAGYGCGTVFRFSVNAAPR
jgi:uncharacterized repeat protein (TIGR03803 family)